MAIEPDPRHPSMPAYPACPACGCTKGMRRHCQPLRPNDPRHGTAAGPVASKCTWLCCGQCGTTWDFQSGRHYPKVRR